MKDGTLVTLGSGNTVYRAYRTDPDGWQYKYTLVPEYGGRKRYRVPLGKIRIYVPQEVAPVTTSQGSVKRPKGFRRLPESSGSTRHTYVGSKWVWKLGRGERGLLRNQIEAARWKRQTGSSFAEVSSEFGEKVAQEAEYFSVVPIAECHLLPDGILMMERVRPVNDLNRSQTGQELTWKERSALGYAEPGWADRVDCNQIGYNRKNQLVAYDL